MQPSELKTYLHKTQLIVGRNWYSNTKSNPEDIASYYKRLRYIYHKFHSEEGAMHFPIKKEKGESHAQGLIYQVSEIAKQIQTHAYKKVVELGCGVGFNLIKLAQLHPETEFIGFDLTPRNLEVAKQVTADLKLSNLRFKHGNFDQLELEDFDGPDLIYGIEAICHSANFDHLAKVCYKALNEKGCLLIFDGYGLKEHYEDADVEMASRYFHSGFFLPKPQYLNATVKSIEEAGFIGLEDHDFTTAILPNFVHFEKGVALFFRFP